MPFHLSDIPLSIQDFGARSLEQSLESRLGDLNCIIRPDYTHRLIELLRSCFACGGIGYHWILEGTPALCDAQGRRWGMNVLQCNHDGRSAILPPMHSCSAA